MDQYILHSLAKELKNPSAFVLYLYLSSIVDVQGSTGFQLSHQTLVDGTGLTKTTVIKCTRFLAERGFIKIERPFPTKAPIYSVLYPWKKKDGTSLKNLTVSAKSKQTNPEIKKRKSKTDLQIEKYQKHFQWKLAHFKKELSEKEQKEFIEDFRKRKGLHNYSEAEVTKLAVNKWFDLHVVG